LLLTIWAGDKKWHEFINIDSRSVRIETYDVLLFKYQGGNNSEYSKFELIGKTYVGNK
jgi:hypothetical protein